VPLGSHRRRASGMPSTSCLQIGKSLLPWLWIEELPPSCNQIGELLSLHLWIEEPPLGSCRCRATGSGCHCRRASKSKSHHRHAFGSGSHYRLASGFGIGRRSHDRRPLPPRTLMEPPPCAPRWAHVTRASWCGIKS
jgi:hypothetical protein